MLLANSYYPLANFHFPVAIKLFTNDEVYKANPLLATCHWL